MALAYRRSRPPLAPALVTALSLITSGPPFLAAAWECRWISVGSDSAYKSTLRTSTTMGRSDDTFRSPLAERSPSCCNPTCKCTLLRHFAAKAQCPLRVTENASSQIASCWTTAAPNGSRYRMAYLRRTRRALGGRADVVRSNRPQAVAMGLLRLPGAPNTTVPPRWL